MTCKLCEAIRAGMPVTADTPLPCRLRPDTHEPDPADPFHGASFSPPNGAKTFEPSFVRELNDHLDSTTAEQRVEAHQLHIVRALDHLSTLKLAREVPTNDSYTADFSKGAHQVVHPDKAGMPPDVTFGIHPLDALTKKDG